MRNVLLLAAALFVMISCKNDTTTPTKETATAKEKPMTFDNKGQELVYKLIEKVGSYDQFKAKKDVVYTYTYRTPDTKADISTEKYIFEGELSYGNYKQHERTLPELEGAMEQGYDGQEYWMKIDGKLVTDEAAIQRVAFNRPTNYYWFAMFQKLSDPGVQYEYLGKKEIDSKTYDIVKVSFDTPEDAPSDIYQLYINQETALVDQFLFTVADFGLMEKPLIMQVEYEKVGEFLIPTKRKYKGSTWDAEILDTPWIDVTWTNIKFDNNLQRELFQK